MATPKTKTTQTKPASSPPQPETKNVTAPPMATPAPVMETKDITKAVGAAPIGLTSAPAWLQKAMAGAKPRGLELVDKADIIMPRLVLAQDTSPEVKLEENKHLGIKTGDIFDNISKAIYAKAGEPLKVIPVVLGKARFLLGDYNKDEGILCRADDALTARPGGQGKDQGGQPTTSCEKCVLKEWDEEEGTPACSLFYNIVVLLPDFDMKAVVWSLKHTGAKVAKRFLSTAAGVNADFFSKQYVLGIVSETNGKNSWKNYSFQILPGWVSEEQYNFARSFYENLKKRSWTADTTDLGKEESVTPAAPEPGSDIEENAAPAEVPPSPSAGSAEDDAF